ncbi:MAG: hypothetical protein NVSMB22_23000 [Chloroflexota bacterium]
MPLVRMRGLAVALATLVFLLLSPATLSHVTRGTLASSGDVQAQGVQADVAASTLNAMSQKNARLATHKLTEVRFILNWLPNVEFAGLWVAEQQGLWRRAGLHMKYVPYSQSVHPETDVPTQGGNVFGFQSGAAIAIARATGVPIQALYTDTQKSVFGLTVMAKSGIKTVADLRGKRVGYQPHELYVPEAMLANVGLKPTDWKPVPVLFDINQLISGQVDAFLTFVTNEPINLKLKGIKARTFPAANYGFHFYDDVLFTYTKLITGNPSLVGKVVRIVAQGFRFAHTHVSYTARLTTRVYFPASGGASAAENLKQQTMELKAFAPFSKDSHGKFSGLMTTAVWRDSINTLSRYGMISTRPNASTIFTNRFNPYR